MRTVAGSLVILLVAGCLGPPGAVSFAVVSARTDEVQTTVAVRVAGQENAWIFNQSASIPPGGSVFLRNHSFGVGHYIATAMAGNLWANQSFAMKETGRDEIAKVTVLLDEARITINVTRPDGSSATGQQP